MSAYKLTAIGSPILDILAMVDDDFITAENMVKGQTRLISAEDSAQLYNNITVNTQQSGGSAANTAAGFASLGGACAFIGMIANDLFGQQFTSDITGSGVDFKADIVTERGPTATCIVAITPDGERTMSTHLGVAVHLAPDAVDVATIRDSEIVFLEGYLFLQEMGMDTLQATALMAHTADRRIALTLSDPFVVQMKRDAIADFVEGHVDILLANEDEIKLLFETDDLDAALNALSKQVTLAVVTCGADGCIVVTEQMVRAVPCEPIANVIDTTGAGDLFASGFLYGLTHGLDIIEAAALGNQCAGVIVQQIGARPQQPLRQFVLSAAA